MRITFHIAIIISMLFAPWWLTALILLSSCFVINHFYEAIIYGLVIDSIYGSKFGLYGFTFIWTVSLALVVAVSAFIKPRIS